MKKILSLLLFFLLISIFSVYPDEVILYRNNIYNFNINDKTNFSNFFISGTDEPEKLITFLTVSIVSDTFALSSLITGLVLTYQYKTVTPYNNYMLGAISCWSLFGFFTTSGIAFSGVTAYYFKDFYSAKFLAIPIIIANICLYSLISSIIFTVLINKVNDNVVIAGLVSSWVTFGITALPLLPLFMVGLILMAITGSNDNFNTNIKYTKSSINFFMTGNSLGLNIKI